MANGFITALPNLMNGILGGLQTFQGISLMQSGANLQAESYRTAGVASRQAGEFNAEIERRNTALQLDQLSRQINRVSAQQRAAAGTSGFAVTSGSFLDVMNSTMSQFERQIVQTRTASRQRQQSILFEAQAAQVQAENQARGAEFAGQVQAHQARGRAVSGLFSLGNNARGLF